MLNTFIAIDVQINVNCDYLQGFSMINIALLIVSYIQCWLSI